MLLLSLVFYAQIHAPLILLHKANSHNYTMHMFSEFNFMHSTSHTFKSKANPNENQIYYTHAILKFYNQSDFFVSVHTYLLILDPLIKIFTTIFLHD
jgi:hypothetical protein